MPDFVEPCPAGEKGIDYGWYVFQVLKEEFSLQRYYTFTDVGISNEHIPLMWGVAVGAVSDVHYQLAGSPVISACGRHPCPRRRRSARWPFPEARKSRRHSGPWVPCVELSPQSYSVKEARRPADEFSSGGRQKKEW